MIDDLAGRARWKPRTWGGRLAELRAGLAGLIDQLATGGEGNSTGMIAGESAAKAPAGVGGAG